jgi:hypothetical protein
MPLTAFREPDPGGRSVVIGAGQSSSPPESLSPLSESPLSESPLSESWLSESPLSESWLSESSLLLS